MPARFDTLAYTEAWNSRDVDRLADAFAADVEFVTPDLPEGVFGRDAVRNVAQEWFRTFEDLQVQLLQGVQEADKAAMLLRVQGTNTGDLELAPGQRVPATGRRVDYRIASFVTLDATQKVKRSVSVFDNDDLMSQLKLGGASTAAGAQRERQPPQW